ncbi:hypothetical protein [Burkholderia ubonensis]|uniref:Uncharacterized protein n=1 Tax=Burkholderia ubonensis TaxID=101571 RepID=A0AAW3N621_9BURK|nr:hypothetical protein [Burkholderia ubonensis]KVT43092.1 hypothetical protein WK53_17125 [Burkholderia ubonensis]
MVNSATADTSETQREQIGKFDSLSGQAMAVAVFGQKPRPSPLRDAQQAFETKFPNVPRPVDLNKIYVNAYQDNGTPPTRVLESSRSVADYIAERYTGGGDITLDVDTEKGTTYSLFSFPNAVSDEDKVNGATPQEIEKFINHLASDKAKDVNVQNDEYFRTPGQDGKTPLQKLGEIRKELIQADTDQQYADGTLSKKAQDLAKKITQNPTQTDLERAYPDEGHRPRVSAYRSTRTPPQTASQIRIRNCMAPSS